MIQVYIVTDGDWNEPEVQISGSAKILSQLGEYLNSVQGSVRLVLPTEPNKFYPISIDSLVLESTFRGGGRLTVAIDPTSFNLAGPSAALNKLGDSLVNFFDDNSFVGEHFQLDYYDGNEVLNETNYHLIFLCDR